jgi:hypothetical protein
MRQEGFLEFLSLVALGGLGGCVALFHVNHQTEQDAPKIQKDAGICQAKRGRLCLQ